MCQSGVLALVDRGGQETSAAQPRAATAACPKLIPPLFEGTRECTSTSKCPQSVRRRCDRVAGQCARAQSQQREAATGPARGGSVRPDSDSDTAAYVIDHQRGTRSPPCTTTSSSTFRRTPRSSARLTRYCSGMRPGPHRYRVAQLDDRGNRLEQPARGRGERRVDPGLGQQHYVTPAVGVAAHHRQMLDIAVPAAPSTRPPVQSRRAAR